MSKSLRVLLSWNWNWSMVMLRRFSISMRETGDTPIKASPVSTTSITLNDWFWLLWKRWNLCSELLSSIVEEMPSSRAMTGNSVDTYDTWYLHIYAFDSTITYTVSFCEASYCILWNYVMNLLLYFTYDRRQFSLSDVSMVMRDGFELGCSWY